MGYDTYYMLKVVNEKDVPLSRRQDASIRLVEICGEVWDTYKEDIRKRGYDYRGPFDWLSGDCHRWYEHERDMLALSREFPEILFCLYGEEEDSDDRWRQFFLNGQECYQQEKFYYDPPPVWAEVSDMPV